MKAWLATDPDRTALDAFEHARAARRVAAAMLMRCVAGEAIGVERPLDVILGEAVAENGTAVIEHNAIGLAGSRAQHCSITARAMTVLPAPVGATSRMRR